ncbi:unnamed protein product [Merluccius merluccius]
MKGRSGRLHPRRQRSNADAFWGKGFLATAVGTASPDRKKTRSGHKGPEKPEDLLPGRLPPPRLRAPGPPRRPAERDEMHQYT